MCLDPFQTEWCSESCLLLVAVEQNVCLRCQHLCWVSASLTRAMIGIICCGVVVTMPSAVNTLLVIALYRRKLVPHLWYAYSRERYNSKLMCRSTSFQWPSGSSRMIGMCSLPGRRKVTNAFLAHHLYAAQYFGGCHGSIGHWYVDSALHSPFILLPVILSPRSSARSAIVMILEYNLQ